MDSMEDTMTRTKRVKLELIVDVPIRTAESDILDSFNAVLDEPPCDWGDWTVGAVMIADVSPLRSRRVRSTQASVTPSKREARSEG